MRTSMLLIILMMAVSLAANNAMWNGSTETRSANVVSYDLTEDVLEYLPGSSNHDQTQQPTDIETRTDPSYYAPCWANDLLVSSQWNLAARSKIAIDYDTDGYIYVAALTASPGDDDDSIIIMKSTDNGNSWGQLFVLNNVNSLQFIDFDMKVDRNNTDPLIYMVLSDTNITNVQQEMWFFIINQTTSTITPVLFDPDTSTNFVSPTNVAMDITDDATPQIWITYNRITATTGWSSVYSTDGGSTWNYQSHSASNGGGGCDVCVGPDDYVYIVNIYTESSNRVRMNERQFTIYGSYYDVSPTAAEDRYYPSVASEMGAAYGSNVVHVLYQTGSGTTGRIKNSYTTDGGTNWTIDEFWSPIGDVQATRPYVRCGWETDQFISIATRTDWDSLATAWSVDESWGAVTYVNDHRPTGEITSQGIVRTSTGRQLIYREWGSDNLWYDRFDMANSVEEITQGSGQVMNITNNGSQVDIRFSLNQPQPVSINLVDVSGRTVRNLLNQNLSSGDHNLSYDLSGLNGSYIVNFQAGNLNSSEKIFIF
ncbi:MAG: T9SS type A sorting domain-containing protein [bacterium]